MESIRDKVAIVGMGCSKFGERWDCSAWDLVVEATYEAFEDAGVGPKDIQAAWSGTVAYTGGQSLAYPLKLDYIPITRVENLCGTGLETIRAATYALIARAYDLVLCVGFEKTKDRGVGGLGSGEPMGGVHPVFGIEATPPGRYALAATKYFAKYGAEKKHLAMISAKSHYNGARNPKAHLRREVTVEQVLAAPVIAWPLGLFDCCGGNWDNVYQPPQRNFGWDPGFLDPSYWPPYCPSAYGVERVGWLEGETYDTEFTWDPNQ